MEDWKNGSLEDWKVGRLGGTVFTSLPSKFFHPSILPFFHPLCFLACCLLCALVFSLQCHAEEVSVKILSEDAGGLLLEIMTPHFTTETVSLEGQTFQRLVAPGYSPSPLSAGFQLPMKGIHIAVPPTGAIKLAIEDANADTVENFKVAPFIDRTLQPDAPYDASPTLPSFPPSTFLPEKLASLGTVGFLRDVRVAMVQVCPFQYNPQKQTLKFYRRILLRVIFASGVEMTRSRIGNQGQPTLSAPKPGASSSFRETLGAQDEGGYLSLYRNLLINPHFLPTESQQNPFGPSTPRSGIQSSPAAPKQPPPFPAHSAVKIVIAEDGLCQITAKDLLAKGIDLSSISPQTLKLTNKGKAIPVFVAGEKDGRFDREDFIEFWGEFNRGTYSLYGEYTKDNVYWLSWGEEKGARIGFLDVTPQKTGKPESQKAGKPSKNQKNEKEEEQGMIQPLLFQTSVHFEEDAIRGSLGYVDAARDIWFWKVVTRGKPFAHTFELPNPSLGPSPGEGRELSLPPGEGGRGDRSGKWEVKVMLHGLSLSEHHLRFFLNNVVLGDARFSGQREYIFDQNGLPHSILKAGKNTLVIESLLSEETSQSYFNWFSLEYWRTFQADDDFLSFSLQTPGTYQVKLSGFQRKDVVVYKAFLSQLTGYQIEVEPAAGWLKGQNEPAARSTYTLTLRDKILQPTTYVALTTNRKKKPKAIILDTPSDLRSPLNGADYLIIVYDDFYESVLPLAQYRSKRYRTAVVKVSDIYDEFSWGILSPEAIRDFLRYAYHHWQTKPTYVLLVGDATWDFKHSTNYVPSYYFTSFKWGQAASDHLYACVNGDDLLPDLYIGRITPRTKEETGAVIEKILRYEQKKDFGPWRRSLLMLAATGSFVQDSEELLKDFVPAPKGYSVSRVYADKNSKSYGTTAELLDFWNEGVSFVHFTGHGGGNIWADEKLFTFNDVPLLLSNQPAFVTSFTCFTGYFDDPHQGGLHEAFVNKKEGGAIAAFGSTGLGWLRGDYYLERALFSTLFENGTRQLGPAIAEAKVTLLANYPQLTDMVRLYNLLGDPACTLPLPQREIALTARPQIPPSPLYKGGTKGGFEEGEGGVREVLVRASSDAILEGNALLWGVDSANNPVTKPIQIPIQGGKFQVTLPLTSPQSSLPAGGIKGGGEGDNLPWIFRCYAWNEEKGIDAVGATLFFLPGENDIDLTVFTDDITVTSEEGTGSAPPPLRHLSAIVTNLGQKTATDVLVHFFADGRFLGEVIIPEIAGGQSVKAEIPFSPQAEAATILVHVDPNNTLKEINEINNTAERRLIFHTFPITKERGSSGKVASLDDNLTVEIPPFAVSAPSTLSIEAIPPTKVERQLQLFYAPMPSKPAGAIYRLSLVKETSLPATFSATLTFLYDGNASPKTDGQLGIYRQNEETELWEKQPTNILTSQTKAGTLVPVEAQVNRLGKFALLSTPDNLPPGIQLTITDELYRHEREFVSTTPTLTAIIEDVNGVGEIQVQLNDKAVSKDELVFSRSPTRVNASVVNWSPTLSPGYYVWKVIATDLIGNQARQELSFRVAQELLLFSVANHPNPFQKETSFTYVLTEAVSSIAIKIYSSSGRLIALLKDAPGRRGYNEILWDGTDKDGEEVANGVYFYLLTATTQQRKLEKMGKLAKIK